ncbi:filamin-binding LIM protein 1 isoform X1 [Poecilia latipinna]|uniref:filamin-binding LIM protein 1 isoform X1 n=1 Tax=Poecilia latipinna TaxID=48699 RepID=UPI00072E059C|nr:PREDICTED: filamin-binding LIM protein 1 isoform X1 [Poecilia latipinna]XP_014908902.1 PREDICTED: filamin-binding LIM protein 1 isoform X1 [Poecilia latipinna]
MASAAPQKRMVSSVFITLSAPHRATVTQQQQQQQQPALRTHGGPDRQHSAAGDDLSSLRRRAEETSPANTGRNWTGAGPRAKASGPQSQPRPAPTGATKAEVQEKSRSSSAEFFPPPPPDVLPSSFSEDAALPPPPLSLTSPLHPQSPDQHPVSNKEVKAFSPTRGSKHDEETNGIHRNSQDVTTESKDLCGFCRKPMALSEPAIEALNRIYHEGCFQCRSCHVPLAGKQYYNKAGIPLCEGCYQASLELCWTCGEIITDQIIRAIERTYHPSCFTCTTCNQQIGAQAFAQGEVGEVYCLQDYYRKYAPMCSACDQLIIPKEDGTDSYTVECLGRSYHENCYRCGDCGIQLSPEPNEHGCYPLEGKMLCKACHVSLVSGQQ